MIPLNILVVLIDREGRKKGELNDKLNNTSHGLCSIFLENGAINRRTKLSVYKTVFRPILFTKVKAGYK